MVFCTDTVDCLVILLVRHFVVFSFGSWFLIGVVILYYFVYFGGLHVFGVCLN